MKSINLNKAQIYAQKNLEILSEKLQMAVFQKDKKKSLLKMPVKQKTQQLIYSTIKI